MEDRTPIHLREALCAITKAEHWHFGQSLHYIAGMIFCLIFSAKCNTAGTGAMCGPVKRGDGGGGMKYRWLGCSSISVTDRSIPIFTTQMWRVLRQLGKMPVRKVSSPISLCSPHRLIRDDTFRLNWIFAKKRHHLNKIFHKSGNCRPM
jgi:hypothetical protein